MNNENNNEKKINERELKKAKDQKFVGDEFEESIDIEEDKLKDVYDLVIPPGMPHKILMEACDKFNLEVTTRKCALKTIDVEKENLLVLRGELDSVNKAHDYIYQKLSEKYGYKRT